MIAMQWLFSPDKDWRAGPAEFHRVERITRGLLNIDVSGNGCNGDDADVGSAQSHNQRNGVIGSNVGIDE